MDEPTIVTWAIACGRLLEIFLIREDQSDTDRTDVTSINSEEMWAEDLLTRFNQWTSSLGVFASGHASVEHRLRDLPQFHTIILRWLEGLHANLIYIHEGKAESVEHDDTNEDVQSILGGHDENAQDASNFTDEEPFVENSSPLSETSVTFPSLSSAPPQDAIDFVEDDSPIDDSPPLSETSIVFSPLSPPSQEFAHLPFSAERSKAKDIIFRLNRLSKSILDSGSRHRDPTAEAFVDKDEAGNDLTSFFAKLVVLVVDHKFPKADETLRHRMAESMARRRNRIAYRRSCRQRLAKIQPVTQMQPNHIESIVEQKGREGSASLHVKKAEQPPASVTDHNAVPFDMSASVIDPDSIDSHTVGKVSTSSAFTSEDSTQPATLCCPHAPEVAANEIFECPYCCIRCPALDAKGKYWRHHIMQDLEPYICVFPNCKTPQQTFRDAEHWVWHMQSEHLPRKWECWAPIHGTQTFNDADSYIEHIKLSHAGTFANLDLPTLAPMLSKPEENIFTICPFCEALPEDCVKDDSDLSTSANQRLLEAHVSRHLKCLALMSLIWLEPSVTSSACSDLERLLTPRERMAPLSFSEEPDRELIEVYLRELDTDWGNGSLLPGTCSVDDPAWIEWTETYCLASWSRCKEWGFCWDHPVPGDGGKGRSHDDTLTEFAQR